MASNDEAAAEQGVLHPVNLHLKTVPCLRELNRSQQLTSLRPSARDACELPGRKMPAQEAHFVGMRKYESLGANSSGIIRAIDP